MREKTMEIEREVKWNLSSFAVDALFNFVTVRQHNAMEGKLNAGIEALLSFGICIVQLSSFVNIELFFMANGISE